MKLKNYTKFKKIMSLIQIKIKLNKTIKIN